MPAQVTTLNFVRGSTVLQMNNPAGPYRIIEESYRPAPKFTPAQLRAINVGFLDPRHEPRVTDPPVQIEVSGETKAAVETAVRNLQIFFTEAAWREFWSTGDRSFVHWRPPGGSVLMRSEVLFGAVELLDRSLSTSQWGAHRMHVRVVFTRRYFYEDADETQLLISNDNGTNATSVQVFGCNDGSGSSPNKRVNYVELDANDVGGALPTPCRIQFWNNNALALDNLFVGHQATGSPAVFSHFLEAEDATLNGTYCTVVADAIGSGASSGGEKVTVSSLPSSAVDLATWDLTTAQLDAALSGLFHFIMRFDFGNAGDGLPNHSTTQVRFILRDSVDDVTIVGATKWTNLETSGMLQPIDALRIAPVLLGQTTLQNLDLVLQARDSVSGGTFHLDFVQMTPVERGTGFRKIEPITPGGEVSSYSTIYDDGMENDLYAIALSETEKQRVFLAFGGPIMLQPGKLQRLIFLWTNADGTHYVGSIGTVAIFYRRRYLLV